MSFARNKGTQKALFSATENTPRGDEWETPANFFRELDREFHIRPGYWLMATQGTHGGRGRRHRGIPDSRAHRHPMVSRTRLPRSRRDSFRPWAPKVQALGRLNRLCTFSKYACHLQTESEDPMNIDVPSIVQSILAAAITLLACGVAGAGLLYLVRSHSTTRLPTRQSLTTCRTASGTFTTIPTRGRHAA
jgi:hypothetical protein